MQYMNLSPHDRAEVMASLSRMPQILRDTFAAIDPETARTPGPNGLFSPVEHVWHLADLEREGFGVRIERMLNEEGPWLPDFDGAIAAERRKYREKSLSTGLRAFARARQDNIDALARVTPSEWGRRGE